MQIHKNPKKSAHPSTKQSQHNEVWPAATSSNIDLIPMQNEKIHQKVHPNTENLKSNSDSPPNSLLKVLVTVAVVSITICSLAALGIGIYFLVRDAKTTTTVTPAITMATKGWRWSTTGTTVAGTGAPSALAGHLYSPYHVTLDSSNAMYIADYVNNRVQKHVLGSSIGTTVAGQANGVAGSTNHDLMTPAFVLVDGSGNLYVSDTGNHRIQFFQNGNLSGTPIAGTGTLGNGLNQLNNPRGLSLDSNTNTLYIADMNNHRIVRYLSGGATGTVVAGGAVAGTSNTLLHTPVGVYFDTTTDSLYISNYLGFNIVRWVIGANAWTLVAGNPNGIAGTTSSTFYGPTNLIFDPSGNMYVADTLNHRIQFFVAGETNATTIAGVTSRFGSMSHLLYVPYAIALDSEFNLYVADTANHRIQRFLRY